MSSPPGTPDDRVTVDVTQPSVVRGSGGPAPPAPVPTRFAPGAIVAGRYRLVSLLGKGGYGEVYRADDLTLGQPVALKFLPVGVASDQARLAQFHSELRIARQVSHKNVCRLYDLGEADLRRFLTMEYIDGEDLASLLRRIGRIPEDKAIEMARQLCAGLSAAHERGVLHRDLKPANVMLDGQGQIRITDFGLAAAIDDGNAVRAGTPHYMAPELFDGKAASIQSDLYALGLVLYEIFTGKRAIEGADLIEIRRAQDSGALPTPSSLVRDLDPAIERVIMRCLDRDPSRRPGTALAVAAALPGADPLAAALAAGETPSPDLLAAAGETDAWPVAKGLAAVAWAVAGIVLCAALAERAALPRLVTLDKPPAVLADRAEQMLATFGFTEPRADTAFGFLAYLDYIGWIQRTDQSTRRWDVLATDRPPALVYWYRTSPRDLVPRDLALRVTLNDPVPNDTDMHSVVLDPRGRLVQLNSVPPQYDSAPANDAPPPPWAALFEAAELPMADFVSVPPEWTPVSYADTRAAWEGPLAGRPDLRLRVEATAYRGKPVSFYLLGPWSRPTRMIPPPRATIDRVLNTVITVLGMVMVVGALMLARHHVRTGRSDRRGATRVAAFALIAELTAWAVGYAHVPDVRVEVMSFGGLLADALLTGAAIWVTYVALEPYGRRFWPDMLLGWSRLLSGHIRDPRVGRDMLLGVSTGLVLLLIDIAGRLLPQALGYAAASPRMGRDVNVLTGTGETLLVWLVAAIRQLELALTCALLFIVLRLLTRRPRLAIGLGLTLIVFWWAEGPGSAPAPWLELTVEIAFAAMFTFAAIRVGLLASSVALFVAAVGRAIPFTLEVSHWSAVASNWTIALVIALALFGFYASRAGQSLLGDWAPE